MSGIEGLEKLLGPGFGQNNLLEISGLKGKLWIQSENRGALLCFGRSGYLRCAILQQFRVLIILIRIALTQLVDNKILAHRSIIIKEKQNKEGLGFVPLELGN